MSKFFNSGIVTERNNVMLVKRQETLGIAWQAFLKTSPPDDKEAFRAAWMKAREAALTGASPQERVFARAAQARPVLERIQAQLDAWQVDPQVLPKSGIGRAVAYARKLWPGLVRYTTIGNAPIDNNATERGMRRVAMHRKNSLFSASDAGAEGYATLMTLTQSALLHDLDPIAYLNDIIEDIHFDRQPLAKLTPLAYARRAMAVKRLS